MAGEEVGRKGTISQYFTTLHCPVCDELTQLGVCSRCRAEPQQVAVTLYQDMRQWERQQDQLLKVRTVVRRRKTVDKKAQNDYLVLSEKIQFL